MNRNGNLNIINEFYSKCYKQKQDITDSINEILKGVHNLAAIDKVKSNILEKIENFEESVRMMEREVNQYIRDDDKFIWKK
jgi:hypothetical protein